MTVLLHSSSRLDYVGVVGLSSWFVVGMNTLNFGSLLFSKLVGFTLGRFVFNAVLQMLA